MIAIDTNVLVRVVTGDDPDQQRAALELMSTQTAWVAKTVLLETVWVLRHSYGLERPAILHTLRVVAGNERIRLEDEPASLAAIESYARGMDFTDALHLASSQATDGFATFDQKMSRDARRVRARPEVRLLSPVGG